MIILQIDLSKYNDTLNSAISVYNQWEQYNNTLKSFKLEYDEVKNIYEIANREEKDLKASLSILEMFYDNQKKNIVAYLREQITNVINIWYNNDYNLQFETVSKTGKIMTVLVDKNRYGSLDIVCGDAVKQTISSLFAFTFIKSCGGDFVFLDEAYSNLGIEEINRLPEVLKDVDLQLFMIEHKCKLIDNSYATNIHISRDKNGSHVSIEDSSNLLDETYALLDLNVNEQDIELLKKYGFLKEEVEE